MRWSPIHGTGKRVERWSRATSLFSLSMAARGFEVILDSTTGETFEWGGKLDGTPFERGNPDWVQAGLAAAYFFEDVEDADLNFIAHSHGGAVVAEFLAFRSVRALVTVGTPARKDVKRKLAAALHDGRLGAWMHLFDARWDWIASLGQLFDERLFGSRAMKVPGMLDVPIAGIGHSNLLHEPEQFHHVEALGVLDLLRTGRLPAPA